MNFRSFITGWLLPPKVTQLLKKPRTLISYNEFSNVPEQYKTSYQDIKLLETIKLKTEKYLKKLTQLETLNLTSLESTNLFALNYILSQKSEQELDVIDIGGQLGITYYHMRKLSGTVNFNWKIMETKEMVNLGKMHFETNGLEFLELMNSMKLKDHIYDVAIISNSLQYLTNPNEYIELINQLKPSYVFISSCPITSDYKNSFVIIQESNIADNGPGKLDTPIEGKIKYPVKIFSLEDYIQLINKLNDYKILAWIDQRYNYYTWGTYKFTTKGTLLELKQSQ